MQRVDTDPVVQSLERMILDGASVNFYMFYGGTNFGFTAGANDGGPGSYNSDVTSYDYDAPMDESGAPTEKYFALRAMIGKYFPLPNVPVPDVTKRVKLPNINLKPQATLLDSTGRKFLANYTRFSETPMSFEALDQYSGFVLYETKLPYSQRDPVMLKFGDLRDRAYIYVNRQFVGIISRANKIYSIPIGLSLGDELQIIVENEGRINYGNLNDFKGILSNVYYGTQILANFTMTGFPFDEYRKIDEVTAAVRRKQSSQRTPSARSYIRSGPTLFYTEFILKADELADTYLDPTGWGKGVVFLNGFNLGRYWPLVGPQITLYVPKEILRLGTNTIAILELQMAPESGLIQFSESPRLDGNY